MSIHDRVLDAQRKYRKIKERFWGARKNLRDARKRLEEVNKRLPKAQGGVKEKLQKEKSDLLRRKQLLAYQVKNRKKNADHAEKKFEALRKLEKEHQVDTPVSGVVTPDRPWNPYRKPVAGWIVQWLDKSWEAGWRGILNSGFRDPAYSEGLCYNMCGHPTCPGTCAGRGSGHSQYVYPGGCVDLSDYNTFESIQYRIGSPLRNDLPSDPVHFSVTGH